MAPARRSTSTEWQPRRVRSMRARARRSWRWRVLFLERMRLGTPYPAVVDRVREVAPRPALFGRCELAMDATGLGMPVLDMLRAANLGCRIVPVLLTGGEREKCVKGIYH